MSLRYPQDQIWISLFLRFFNLHFLSFFGVFWLNHKYLSGLYDIRALFFKRQLLISKPLFRHGVGRAGPGEGMGDLRAEGADFTFFGGHFSVKL